MAERVKIFGAALLACFVALCGTAQGQTLNVRQLAVTTAVENASIPASTPLRWYQGESLVFRHYSTQGGTNANWGSLSNLVAIWSLTANQTEDPDNTNAYLYSTGVVTAASGLVSFAVSPEMSAMPASNYWSYVTLYQTDETGATNNYIGVLHRSAAVVGYRMIHPVYTGPYPIPTNGVSIDPTARALAASNTALIIAETNRAQVAEASINSTATNALALAQSATGTAAAVSAALVIETNRAIQAEAGINTTATNALTIGTNALAIVQSLQSSGLITGTQASNITASILSTGTAHYATTAGGIAFEGEGSSLTVIPSNGVLHVRTVTNSVNVYVIRTNGTGYNGPPVGTVWTNPVVSGNSLDWDIVVPDGYEYGFDLTASDGGTNNLPSEASAFIVEVETIGDFQGAAPTPVTLTPFAGAASGTLTIDWVPITNTYTIGDMTGYLRHTNSTTYGDGVLNGTNGVYWTRNGTNYWILLP